VKRVDRLRDEVSRDVWMRCARNRVCLLHSVACSHRRVDRVAARATQNSVAIVAARRTIVAQAARLSRINPYSGVMRGHGCPEGRRFASTFLGPAHPSSYPRSND
jgi:hypothetical protein